jgi:hypothetical protein
VWLNPGLLNGGYQTFGFLGGSLVGAMVQSPELVAVDIKAVMTLLASTRLPTWSTSSHGDLELARR